MQDECEKWHIDLESEIDSFCGKYSELFTFEKVQEFKDFIKRLKDVGQKVSDWYWDRSRDDELKNEYYKYITTIF